MQKKIIALAIAAAFAAPAVAMADATVYGVLDAGIRSKQLIGANGASGTATTSMDMRGLYSSNRWGIKSSEDLGDGMKANVVLEADFVPGTTSATGVYTAQSATYAGQLFDRQMTAELAGGFGAAKIGYQYSTAFKANALKYDAFKGAFITSLYHPTDSVLAARAYIADYTNKFGDVSVNAQWVMNNADTASNTPASTGQGRAIGVDYAAGPISVGGSYSSQDSGTTGNFATPATLLTAGAGFNFGDGNVNVGYAKKTTGSGASATVTYDSLSTTMWLGAAYNLSSKIGATIGYYKNTANTGAAGAPDVVKSKMIGMVTYAMSKKTTAYVGAERETANVASGATALAADDQVTSSYSVGLAVAF